MVILRLDARSRSEALSICSAIPISTYHVCLTNHGYVDVGVEALNTVMDQEEEMVKTLLLLLGSLKLRQAQMLSDDDQSLQKAALASKAVYYLIKPFVSSPKRWMGLRMKTVVLLESSPPPIADC